MKESYSEFIKNIKKVKSKRIHKITHSLGVRDAMNHYRKNRPKESKFVLSPEEYYTIIRSINRLIGEQLLRGTAIKLPYRSGSFYIEKINRSPKLDINGKLVYRAPIDWDATLRLWYESEEDYKNKTILKTSDKVGYRFHYDKRGVVYANNQVT